MEHPMIRRGSLYAAVQSQQADDENGMDNLLVSTDRLSGGKSMPEVTGHLSFCHRSSRSQFARKVPRRDNTECMYAQPPGSSSVRTWTTLSFCLFYSLKVGNVSFIFQDGFSVLLVAPPRGLSQGKTSRYQFVVHFDDHHPKSHYVTKAGS